jgi:hypothetical protein
VVVLELFGKENSDQSCGKRLGLQYSILRLRVEITPFK